VRRDTSLVTSRERASITVLVALATVAILAVLPSYRSQSCTGSDQFNQPVCTSGPSRTIPEENGNGVLLILSIPAAIAAIGVVRPTRRVLLGIAITLSIALLPAMLSVGIFFVPTAVAAWFVSQAASSSSTSRKRTSSSTS
jgi:hypothetical protein